MKALRLILATLAMLLLLASCGGGSSVTQPGTDTDNEEPLSAPGEGKFPIDDETDIASVPMYLVA